MTPSELATDAAIAANKVGQDRVGSASIISRGKRLYQRKRLSIHKRFMGVFYRTRVTFVLTTTNIYTPSSPAMIAPILVERQVGSGGSNPLYQPVRPMDSGAPDAYLGWAVTHASNVRTIEFSQTGQAGGSYRLTFLEAHAPGDADEMILPLGYEDVLVAELGAWLRRCYEEDDRSLKGEAKELEEEADGYLRLWNGEHPLPGLTNG